MSHFHFHFCKIKKKCRILGSSAGFRRLYLEHGGLRTSQLVERRFARRHFYDGAPQRPDISRLPITPRPLVYNLWGHVLKSSY